MWNQGKRKLGDLSRPEMASLERFIDKDLYRQALIASRFGNLDLRIENDTEPIYIGNRTIDQSCISSKQIREYRRVSDPLYIYKSGLLMSPSEGNTWLLTLNKVTSTNHKNVILTAAHGAVYTKERCFRFGLRETPNCPQCGQIETLMHKLYQCRYAKLIWDTVSRCTGNEIIENDEIEIIKFLRLEN